MKSGKKKLALEVLIIRLYYLWIVLSLRSLILSLDRHESSVDPLT